MPTSGYNLTMFNAIARLRPGMTDDAVGLPVEWDDSAENARVGPEALTKHGGVSKLSQAFEQDDVVGHAPAREHEALVIG